MTLVALTNALLGDRMVERFHAEPRVQATELLLQERVPRQSATIEPRPLDEMRVAAPAASIPVRRYRSPHTMFPHTQFLSNGNYVTSVTNAGGGASVWRGLPVTRWRRDATRDADGQFIYLRDVRSGAVWSATYQPSRREPDDYAVTFSADRASFRRRDDDISTQLDIAVSTEDDVEVRRLTVRNHGTRIRELDVTSYAEIVLTAAVERPRPSGVRQALRRDRVSARQRRAALPSAAARSRRAAGVGVPRAEPRGPPAGAGRVGNRSRALPRPRPQPARPAGARRPRAVGHDRHRARSDRQPAPADPAAARRDRAALLRHRHGVRIARRPRRSRGSTTTRAPPARTFALAMTHAQSGLRHLGISADDAVLFERLASRVLGTDGSLRASADDDRRERARPVRACGRTRSPAICRSCSSASSATTTCRWCGRCCRRRSTGGSKGLSADVVILNEHPVSYLDEMQAQLTAVLDDGPWSTWQHRPGGAYLLRADRMGRAERVLLEAVARRDPPRRPRRSADAARSARHASSRRRRRSCRRRRRAATRRRPTPSRCRR